VNAREQALKAHRTLLNGSGKLEYFESRGITEETLKRAYVGYEAGAFTYPCVAKGGGLLGIHYKSEKRDEQGKRRQWWGGYAEDLPRKGHGKKPDDPAKVIPFGLEDLTDLEPGSLVVLCCGEEDALSVRQAGYAAVSQPGAGLLEEAYARAFEGLEVVVFYDGGEEGEACEDALKLLEAGAKSACRRMAERRAAWVRHQRQARGRSGGLRRVA
jgi:DNA primase